LFGIVYACAPAIAVYYHSPLVVPTLRVLALRIPLIAVSNVQHAYVSKHMMFKKYFFSTLAGTLVSGVVGIALAYLGFGVWALVVNYLVHTVMDICVLFFTVKWRPKWMFSWQRLQHLIGYGWKMVAAGFLEVGYNELRTLIIGKVYSSGDLAYYNKGESFPRLVIDTINTSISGVLFPAMSREQDNREAIRAMVKRGIKTSTYLLTPLLVGMAMVAKPFVVLLLTEKWLPCVPYLQVFCFVYILIPLQTINIQTIKSTGRSDFYLILQTVKKVVSVAALLLVMHKGVMMISIVVLIIAILEFFINAYPNYILIGYGPLKQLQDVMPNLLLSTVMGGAVYLTGYLPLPVLPLLCIQILVGLGVYGGVSVLFRMESYTFSKEVIKQFVARKQI
jgi:O-antigen/teichoic acid export membrane protein